MTQSESRCICLAFVLLTGLFCQRASAATHHPSCEPAFPLQSNVVNGWQGADAAYSILLGDGRDLWIFGDTLYGKKREVHDSIPTMVRNSIGISRCDDHGTWNIEYFLRKASDGKPADFFTAQHPKTWYWAMDGFRSGSDVWITLLCVRASDAKSAMGFETCGSDLAKISSLGPDPQQWKITYFPLVADGMRAYPSATVVADGNYADLFALREEGDRSLLATRLPLNGLDDPKKQLEYLAADGSWKRDFDPAHAAPVMTPGISELSIRYHPELKRWLAVMFKPGMFSKEIVLRTAPAATGPWSDGQVIYTVPEMRPDVPGYDKDTFCYAGKEHPEFEHGDLVFTYACNTFSVPKLASELNIYFPRVVRMPMPSIADEKPAK